MRHRLAGSPVAGVVLACLLGVFLVGCTQDDEPIVVEVCGDTSVPDEIEQVRVVLLDASGNETQSGVRGLVECPEDFVRRLPQQFEYPTYPDEGMVLVQGLDGEEVVVTRARVRTTFDPGSTIEVSLNSACFGIECPEETKTCVNGACEFIPQAGDGPLNCGSATQPDDAGMDAASDTGESASDAGDTGPAGPRYCPEPDAGDAS